MASLPPNFVFPFNNVEERSFRRASLNILNSSGGGRLSTSDFSMPLTPNINIRQASPDEADSKVSVANLSPVPLRSPLAEPPDTDWACVFASLGSADHPCHVQLLGDGRLLLDVNRRRSADERAATRRDPDRRLSADERLRADHQGNVRRWLSAECANKKEAAHVRRWLSPDGVDAPGSVAKRSPEADEKDVGRSAEVVQRKLLTAEDSRTPEGVCRDISEEASSEMERGSTKGDGSNKRSKGEGGVSRWLGVEPHSRDFNRSLSAEGDRRDGCRKLSTDTGVTKWPSADPEASKSGEAFGTAGDRVNTETNRQTVWLSVKPDVRDVIIRMGAEYDNRDHFLKLSAEEGNREVSRRLGAETQDSKKLSAKTPDGTQEGGNLNDRKADQACDSLPKRTSEPTPLRTSSNSGCEQRPNPPERVASTDSGDCFHNDDSPLIKSHLRRRLGSSSLSTNEGTDSTDC